MTWKEFKKRTIAILNDDRSYFLEGEELEAWKQRQKGIAERKAEIERREADLMAHWFEQEAYVNGNWFKRLLLRMQYIFRDKHGEGNPPKIPDHIRMEIARCLLPDIIAFCESEEGKKEFEEWKAKRSIMQNAGVSSPDKKEIIISNNICEGGDYAIKDYQNSQESKALDSL